jgi:hypothetical protein
MMTQQEIIAMAKKVGFERLGVYAQFGDDVTFYPVSAI